MLSRIKFVWVQLPLTVCRFAKAGIFITTMLDKKNIIQNEEKAVLIGLVQKDQTEQQVHEYLDELAFLAETAGAVTVKRFTQNQHKL